VSWNPSLVHFQRFSRWPQQITLVGLRFWLSRVSRCVSRGVWRRRLLRCQTGAVSSTDDRDGFIRREYFDEGRSAIELAAEWGLSRSQIHRIVAAGPPVDGDDPDPLGLIEDGSEMAADGDEFDAVGPFTFTGMSGRPNDPDEVFVDAAGRVCVRVDVFRACCVMRDAGDFEGARAVRADVDAQIAAAGWRRVSGSGGRWHWERIGEGRPQLRGA
jgi:hypothetical protein